MPLDLLVLIPEGVVVVPTPVGVERRGGHCPKSPSAESQG